MTAPRRSASRAAGLGLAVLSASSFGLSGPARPRADGGGVDVGGGGRGPDPVARRCSRRSRWSSCAAAGGCCAATSPGHRLRPGRRRRQPARVLQRRGAHAGRRRPADRVHRAGPRGRLAVAAPRPAARPPHRRSERWSARPACVLVLDLVSGVGARRGRHRVGAGRDGGGRGLLRAVVARRTAGCPARCSPRAGCWSVASPCWWPGRLGSSRSPRRTAPVAFAGATVPWWAAGAGARRVTAALSYATGIAATRRLGSRLASFVALSRSWRPSSSPGCCSARCRAAARCSAGR